MGEAEVLAATGRRAGARAPARSRPPAPSPVSLLARAAAAEDPAQGAPGRGVHGREAARARSAATASRRATSPRRCSRRRRCAPSSCSASSRGATPRSRRWSLRRFFKPFVEDELEARFPERARLLAHPAGRGAARGARRPRARAAALAVGPEGGWTPYEAEALRARGFAPVLARRKGAPRRRGGAVRRRPGGALAPRGAASPALTRAEGGRPAAAARGRGRSGGRPGGRAAPTSIA